MSPSESESQRSLLGFAADGYGNNPEHIEDLRSAVAAAQQRVDEGAARLERLRTEIDDIKGHGESEKGAVKVTVDASGRLVDIVFTSAVLRFGTTKRLRQAIKDASGDAVDDATAQYRELTGVDEEGIADPVGEFLGGMPEVTRMLPPELVNRLRGQSVVDKEERAARKADRQMWEGPNPYE